MNQVEEKSIGIEEEGMVAVGLDEIDAPQAFPKNKKFKLYDCTVRLGGELLHTVLKKDVTARTIKLLQKIHGVPAIVDIHDTGKTIMLNETEHYYELALDYSKTMNPAHGIRLVEQVFNCNMSGFTNWYNDRMLKIDSHREMMQNRKNEETAVINAGRAAGEAEAKATIAKRATLKLTPVEPVTAESPPEESEPSPESDVETVSVPAPETESTPGTEETI